MKTLVIIGVSTRGIRTTKTVKTTSAMDVLSNPSKFDFAKVSAVMTEKSYNQTMDIK